MPRDLFQIAAFTNGIISSPDEHDIPNEAATFSTDVDAEGAEGALRGRKVDLEVMAGDAGRPMGASEAAFIHRTSGVYDLVYHDMEADEFSIVQDFYGTPTNTVMGTVAGGDLTVNETTQIVPFNREVRIGRSTGNVKWIGYVEEEQLGDAGNTDTPIIEDASLINPAGDNFYDKLIHYNDGVEDWIYALVRSSDTLRKINMTSGERTDVGTFLSVQAICEGYNTIGGNPIIWVLDKTTGGHSLYALDLTDDSFPAPGEHVITDYVVGLSGATTSALTDICAVDNTALPGADVVFIAAHFGAIELTDDMNAVGGNLLVSVDTATVGAMTVTDRTPRRKSDTTTDGSWVWQKVGDGSYHATNDTPAGGWGNAINLSKGGAVQETFPLSLVRLGQYHVAWLYRTCPFTSVILGVLGTVRGPYYKETGPIYTAGGMVIAAILRDNYSIAANHGAMIIEGKIDSNASVIQSPFPLSGIAFDATGNGTWHYTMGTILKRELTTVAGVHTAIAGALYRHAFVTDKAHTLQLSYSVSDLYNDGVDDWLLLAPWEGFSGVDRIQTDASLSTSLEHLTEAGSASLTQEYDTTQTGDFPENSRMFYKISFTYEGTQEGPLSKTTWALIRAAGKTHNVDIVIGLLKAALSRRITAINLYRAEGASTSQKAEGFYRLVATKNLDIPTFSESATGVYSTRIYDTYEAQGASYEARTGMSETLTDNSVQYELSTLLNGSLFTAKCRHAELDDADHMIFKSKPYRFDAFNWPDEHIRLPDIPTAISSFGGRLFVFTSKNVYRINPEGLFVEEVLDAAGCMGYQSLVQTEIGIFFCDAQNVYVTDGTKIVPVGLPIRESLTTGGFGWRNVGHTLWNPKAVYSSETNQVHFIVSYSGTSVYAFSYHIPYKRWDILTLLDTGGDPLAYGAYTGKNGEVYYSNDTTVNRLGGGATRMAFLWISKKIDAGDATQNKKFYAVQADQTATTVTYSKDGGVYKAVPVGSTDRIAKSYQVKLQGTGSTSIVYSLAVMFRRMVGFR